MRDTNHVTDVSHGLNASPSYSVTDIRVHVKAPLNGNWYPCSGVVEGLWICAARGCLVHEGRVSRKPLTDPCVQYRFAVFGFNER